MGSPNRRPEYPGSQKPPKGPRLHVPLEGVLRPSLKLERILMLTAIRNGPKQQLT